MTTSAELIEVSESRSAHNYHPLPVVIHEAHGAWVTDVEGKRYLDCLSGYSSLNFGHGHPKIIEAARDQLERLTLTSRAFYHDQFARFCAGLGDLTGKDMILPMNTGAEAVETAIKVARKWGYQVKGVEPDQANIIVMENNFHGRTTTIISFSTDPDAHDDFGPYTPGFRTVPYGSAEAVRQAVDANTVAVMVEPIQGEAGVLVPPEGYLTELRQLCSDGGILMIADEVQSGLGRTGQTFACDVEGVVPDIYVLGKALGGGVVPVSAIAADRDVLGVIHPGQHGSTFGGNPLACAVGIAVVELLNTGEFQARAAKLGESLHSRLRGLLGRGVTEIRGRGLWAGVDIDPSLATGREVSNSLLKRGVLVKDTHGSTIRLAPPIVVSEDDLIWAIDQLADAIHAMKEQ
ncbi:ornithine--oxo-acid transaminase [Nonomuraea sp. KC401]|uniref:ornithine--oxo-acid transaminase n=1 Tax=unclassified Nonomuraea TaxID=2593643 RepID=UPI0010FE78C6|nr:MULTISPECIES: ornithine--oxo-acid transaminase [unclassified Nonomuraea]NBE92899.1 ornithine--oxo-acid transaminase [Nonomuraea sp. K271]TLF83364.1 ornithine--oxo-acid transaminase [Nonomuraea sp. KC401]